MYVEAASRNTLKMLLYDTVATLAFLPSITLVLDSTVVRAIRDVSCQEEKSVSSYAFSCTVISAANSVSEFFFELNGVSKSVRKINETSYSPYKDYTAISVKSYAQYLALTAKGYNEAPNAILAYKRKSSGGSEHLFSGVNWEEFGYRDVREIDLAIYQYNEVTKLFVQPHNCRSSYVFRLDDIKILVKDTDINQYSTPAIFLSNDTSFTLALGFVVGNNNSSPNGQPSSPSSTANNTSSSSGLLIALIIFVIVVAVAAIAGIGYVIYRQNAKKQAASYLDQQADNGSQDPNAASQDNLFKSFEGARF